MDIIIYVIVTILTLSILYLFYIIYHNKYSTNANIKDVQLEIEQLKMRINQMSLRQPFIENKQIGGNTAHLENIKTNLKETEEENVEIQKYCNKENSILIEVSDGESSDESEDVNGEINDSDDSDDDDDDDDDDDNDEKVPMLKITNDCEEEIEFGNMDDMVEMNVEEENELKQEIADKILESIMFGNNHTELSQMFIVHNFSSSSGESHFISQDDRVEELKEELPEEENLEFQGEKRFSFVNNTEIEYNDDDLRIMNGDENCENEIKNMQLNDHVIQEDDKKIIELFDENEDGEKKVLVDIKSVEVNEEMDYKKLPITKLRSIALTIGLVADGNINKYKKHELIDLIIKSSRD
jgi:hypothetical protein